ncbi:MAG: cation:dicarboxylase symporter family transporter, partial [Oscillospiraceae bacterium]
MKKICNSLIFKLLFAVVLGVIIGLVSNEVIMNLFVTAKHILSQIIFFCVPLIIIGFIAPSIAQLKSNASKFLSFSLCIAYISSVGAATFSAVAGYFIIPNLSISPPNEALRELPNMLFQLDIPALMPVMSALVFAILIGLATSWTKSDLIEKMLNQFQNIILSIVNRVVIPILPFFIASTFATLAYEGAITKQLPIFIGVIGIVLIGHIIWLAVIYGIGGLVSGKNPIQVLKYYLPAYLTAVGTMSSAATLPVSLSCARKSPILRKDIIDFGIPLFCNIHLCGSV